MRLVYAHDRVSYLGEFEEARKLRILYPFPPMTTTGSIKHEGIPCTSPLERAALARG